MGFVVSARIPYYKKAFRQGLERTPAGKGPGFGRLGRRAGQYYLFLYRRSRAGSEPQLHVGLRRRDAHAVASWRAEADDEFRCACQGCCVTRPTRRAPSLPPFRTGSRFFRSPAAPHLRAPLPQRSGLPCGRSARGARTGSLTDRGHGGRHRQVSAELLALRPRAGRARPGVLPLSAGGLCVRVPRPHHSPLGPG